MLSPPSLARSLGPLSVLCLLLSQKSGPRLCSERPGVVLEKCLTPPVAGLDNIKRGTLVYVGGDDTGSPLHC